MANKKRTFIPQNFRPKVKGEKLIPKKNFVPLSLQSLKRREKKIVCLHVREDCSQTKVLNTHSNKEIISLCHDEIGDTWNFSFFKGKLTFYTKDSEIEPEGIYNRPYCTAKDHSKYHLLNHLMRALEVWDGPLIGPNIYHFHNSSKGYQLTTTVREAIKKWGNCKFDFPKSYFIKGKKQLQKIDIAHLIVKSASGIRSEVATYEHFKKWNMDHLEHLPTFFQIACYGPDIRTHWTHQNCLNVILHHKEGSIDYRYASGPRHFQKYEDQSCIAEFCTALASIEKLHLVGVDFIKMDDKYICLESNPNPGWAGFHRASGDEPQLAKALIHHLSLT